MNDTIPLPDLPIARYRLTLEALDPLHLPPFKGSALRGGFGHTLKRLVCYRSNADCAACGLGNDCVYGYLFETSPPDDAEVLRTHEEVPRPFVIQPPLEQIATYEPGRKLDFHVLLFGHAIAHLPYFVLVFQELGKVGLGRERGKYALVEVQAVHPTTGANQPAYDGETFLSPDLALTSQDVLEWASRLSPNSVTVRLLTPARLKHQKQIVYRDPPFHILFRTLLRRLSSLAYFHGGGQWDIDYAGWIERAKDVQIVEDCTEWQDWERRSGRQHRRISMGGLVGEITYTGDLAPFLPVMALGQWVHVGKGTVFGNGQYELGNGQ